MSFRECTTGSGFQVTLEALRNGLNIELKSDENYPGLVRRSVYVLSCIVPLKSTVNVGSDADIVPGGIALATQHVHETRLLSTAFARGDSRRGSAPRSRSTRGAEPSRSSPKASEGWRRGRDSNPRAGYPARRFRGAPVTTTSVPLRYSVFSAQFQVPPGPLFAQRSKVARLQSDPAAKSQQPGATDVRGRTPGSYLGTRIRARRRLQRADG